MNTNSKQDIDKLNEFLRGERSAVETYEQCIEKLEDPTMKQQLRMLRDSHAARVRQLSARITSLGGSPDDSSGMWGGFAKLVEGSAKMFGKSAAVSALEEGEDHGKRLYEDNVAELAPDTQSFIRTQIMPEQRRTHDSLSAIQQRI